MKNSLANLYEKEATKKVLASLISILIGLLVGAVVVTIVGLTKKAIGLSGMWDGIRIVFVGIFCKGRDAAGALEWGFNGRTLGNMLFRATPIIMTGLSVAVAYKTGLFNIGAPGQYLMGTMASLMIALGIPSSAMPAGLIWVLAFVGGILAGALWGAVPGALKAFLNINEVLACIMTNWLAANIVTWAFDMSNFKNVTEGTKTAYVYKTTFNGVATPKLGLDKLFPNSQVNAGILIAIVFAVAMYVFINKTTLGYELKACGSNRHAARYAGINDRRNIVLSMAIAGGLAGAGAALYWRSRQYGVLLVHLSEPPRGGLQRHSRGPARHQQSHRGCLHRHFHGHAENRRPEPDGLHRLQRVYHRCDHRRHCLPQRLLSGHPYVAGRKEEKGKSCQ